MLGHLCFFFLMIRRPPRSTQSRSSAASDVYKRQTEKRKDAQLAREVELSLPKELNLNQQIALVREYVQSQFVDQGMIADLCIHKSEKNPHVHIMLTMREVSENGFGQKVRSWNDKAHLLTWREEWAVVQNRHLLEAGHDIQVDHRSYADRGIDLEPNITLGRGIYKFLPEGYVHLEDTRGIDRLEEYQRICRENGERIINDPENALRHLSHYDAVFKKEDVIDFAFRHSADAEQFDKVLRALDSSPELIKIGVKKGRATRKNLKIGICGEHGGEPNSVEFCHKIGLDYVSCSPYRVTVAKLAAARAAIKDKQ